MTWRLLKIMMMEETIQRVHEETGNQVEWANIVDEPIFNANSNLVGTKVQISDEPNFAYDLSEDEVQKQTNNTKFPMYLFDDELIGSQHSTSKPKPKMKKKLIVSRKEFLDLKGKVDKILTVVTSVQPPHAPNFNQLQSLEQRMTEMETRETFTVDKILLRV